MSMFGAIVLGLRRGLSYPMLILALWLLNLALTLPAMWTMKSALFESFEDSRVQENLRTGFDVEWFGEFSAQAKGLERTFDPTLTGAGTFPDNLQDWVTGELWGGLTMLVALGVLYGLAWTFLLGGVLERFSRPGDTRGPRKVLQAGGGYFFRFIRLTILSAPLYWLAYKVYGWLDGWFENLLRDVTSEQVAVALALVATGVTAFLLVLIHVCFACARIATVVDGRRSMVFAAVRGAGFVLSHPLRTLGLYGVMAATGLAIVALYGWIGPGAGQDTRFEVVFAFAVGQLFLIARLVLRLSAYGGLMALYGAKR